MPDVTVVIPTRDRCPLLGTTLRSVLWQQEVDLEVVVVDDGSTDGTADLVAGLDDPRVRLVRHARPEGVSSARNAGIRAAHGAWVAFLDDDDLWAPDKLATQLRAARDEDRGWAVTGAVSVDEDLRILAGETPWSPERILTELEHYNSVPVGASNVVVRADWLAATGGFDPGLRHMSDWDLWIRIGRKGPPATVPRPFVAYRLHPRSATMDTAIDATEPLAELDVIADLHGIAADRAAVHRWVGWTCLRAGQRRAALRAYTGAIREGDVSSIARAAVALLHPLVGRRTYLRPFASRHIDEEWVAEARVWLSALSDPTVVEGGRRDQG